MTINRGTTPKQLIPGLNKIFGLAYKEIDNEHTALFEVEKSKRSFEERTLMTGFGEAPVKSEGASVQFDDAQESYTARWTHQTIALAFAITEEAMEDNLYDTWSKIRAKALGRSMASTKQTKAANVFNNAFSASYVGGDAVALISTSHPTVAAGNQSNSGGATDLSEAALETATISISLFKDDRGILINAMPSSLHIPTNLRHTAFQIMRSDLSTTVGGATPFTNTNNINSVRAGGYFPKGTFINHRFTDTNAWFVKTDVTGGTTMFVRTPLMTKMEGDFETGNVRYKARERYSFGWDDWRGWYGASGSS